MPWWDLIWHRRAAEVNLQQTSPTINYASMSLSYGGHCCDIIDGSNRALVVGVWRRQGLRPQFDKQQVDPLKPYQEENTVRLSER